VELNFQPETIKSARVQSISISEKNDRNSEGLWPLGGESERAPQEHSKVPIL
jgi:hypothetical protein